MIHAYLLKRGIQFSGYSELSLAKLSEIDLQTQSHLLEGVKQYRYLLADFFHVDQDQPSNKETIKEELEILDLALSKLKLKPLDSESLKTIRSGLVVEIYSLDMKQIYRNFEFLRQCSYDFLSLLVFEWNVLYERNVLITEKIFTQVKKVIQTATEIYHYQDVPTHTLKERHLSHNKIFENTMLAMIPLFHVETGEKAGFIHLVDSKALELNNIIHHRS